MLLLRSTYSFRAEPLLHKARLTKVDVELTVLVTRLPFGGWAVGPAQGLFASPLRLLRTAEGDTDELVSHVQIRAPGQID